jgi:hypothetical protein
MSGWLLTVCFLIGWFYVDSLGRGLLGGRTNENSCGFF